MSRLRIVVLVLVAIIVVVAGLSVFVLRPIVTRMAIRTAEGMGFRDVSLRIDHIGPTRLHIAALTIGPGRALAARDITLDYSIPGLLRHQVNSAEIGEVTIAASMRPGEPPLPFMEHYERTPGDIVLPIDTVRVRKSSLNIVSPAGDYEIAYSGTLKSASPAGLTLDGKVKLTGGAAVAEGTVTGRMEGSGAFEGMAHATSVSFTADGVAVASGQADIAARGSLEGLDEASAQFALVNSRLGGVTLETIDGEADYQPGTARVDLKLNAGNRRLSGTASLEVDTDKDGGPIQVNFDSDLDAADFAGLDGSFGRPATVSGHAAVRVNGTIADFTTVSEDVANHVVPRALRLRGDVTLTGGRVTLGDQGPDAMASGALDIAVADGAVTVRSPKGLDLAVAGRGSAHVGARGGPLATIGPMLQPADIKLAAALDLDATGYGPAKGTLEGTIHIDPSAETAVSAMPVDLHLTTSKPMTIVGERLSKLDLATKINGGIDSFEGETTASFDLDSPKAAAARIGSGHVRLAATIGRRDGATYAILNDCATVRAGSITSGPMTASPGEMSLCPMRKDAPLADLRFTSDAGLSVALAGALKTGETRFRIERDSGDPVEMTAALAPVTIEATKPSTDGSFSAHVATSGGKLDLPAYLARVENVAFSLDLTEGAKGVSGKLDTLEGRLVDTRKLVYFSPFDVSADGTFDAKTAKLSAKLADSSGKLSIEGDARYDMATGDASAEFHAAPIQFTKNGLQPQKLFPVLRGQVTSVTGGMGLDAELERKNGVTTSSADLTVSDVGLQTFIAGIEGIDADIHFSSLLPLATPPNQRVTIKSLNPGIVMPNGEFAFQIKPDGDYVLEHMAWPWAGGRIFADNVHLKTGEGRYVLPLQVDNVDLAALVKLMDLKDLEIESTITGTLPLVIENGVPSVRGGRLTDDGKGGVIRYMSPQAANLFASGGPSASLAIKALNDFQFKSAAITVDGDLTGDLNLGFHISGFNPNLYDGYPIEFNLSVNGQLGQLARAASASMNIPRLLQQKLKEGQ